MEGSGYIKLHRKFLDWEWYDDMNCKIVFIHLLLKANYKDKQWRGKTIMRGQLFTSIDILSSELHLTNKQLRITLSKLESTGEITRVGANYGTTISICNYDSYQQNEIIEGKQGANEGQTKGKRTGSKTANQRASDEDTTIANTIDSYDTSSITKGQTNGQSNGKPKNPDESEIGQQLKNNKKEKKEYIPAFELWLQYKKERREAYKSDMSTQEAYKHLMTLAGGSPDAAMLIVKQSIANNWAGLFELKKQNKTSDAGPMVNATAYKPLPKYQ